MPKQDFQSIVSIQSVDYLTWARREMRRFQGERFDFSVQAAGQRHKVLQVVFGKRDGSLLVGFPFFDLTQGVVCILKLPAYQKSSKVSVERQGKTTSTLIKYAHHPDGEAHFSQDGKALTSIRRRSLPLCDAEGHIFSLQLQGLSHFAAVDTKKDDRPPRLRRTLLQFDFGDALPRALKFAGCWYAGSTLTRRFHSFSSGPIVQTQTPDGLIRDGFLVGPPKGWPFETHVLLVTCEEIPRLDESREGLLNFIGGFDPPTTIRDPTRQAELLCALYPAANYAELQARIGSIDITEARESSELSTQGE